MSSSDRRAFRDHISTSYSSSSHSDDSDSDSDDDDDDEDEDDDAIENRVSFFVSFF